MKLKLIALLYPVITLLLALLFLVVYLAITYNPDLGQTIGVALILAAVIPVAGAITLLALGD